VTFAFACPCLSASGAPNEIKVFTDELAAYRGQTLETHVNKARAGPLRLMPEWSYGMAPDWELSLQLPFAVFPLVMFTGDPHKMGPFANPRWVKILAWAVAVIINVELARDARLDEPHFWNAEIIPIVGWRVERWHLVANPGFERALSGSERGTRPTPAAKVAYRAFGDNAYGVELYRDADGGRTAYLAWDGKLGKSDINVGIGRGTSASADRWVLKAIYEVAF